MILALFCISLNLFLNLFDVLHLLLFSEFIIAFTWITIEFFSQFDGKNKFLYSFDFGD